MIAWVALALLCGVPGTVTYAALGVETRKKLCLNPIEGILLVCLIGVVLVGWVSFVLAELGVFHLFLLVSVVAVYTVAIAAVRYRELISFRLFYWPRANRGSLLFLALVVLTSVLYLRPFEYVLGGLDPGVYVNTGVNIARTGSILITDVEVRAMPSEDRGALFGEPEKPWVVGSRQIGFYLRDFAGTVEPHGFHLFPVWIAILYALGGLSFSLFAAPLFAVFSLFAAYCLGRRAFNSSVGLIVAALLATNVAMFWFGRYPAAEMVVQFLFLSGMWAFLVMLDTSSKGFAALSGVTFGLIHLAKIELSFIPFVILIYFGWLWMRARFRKEHRYFALFYLALLIHAFVHASLIATTYTIGVIGFTVPSLLRGPSSLASTSLPHFAFLFKIIFIDHWPFVTALAVVVGALVWALRRFRHGMQRFFSSLDAHERIIRSVVATSLAAGLVYAYYLRPTFGARPELPFPLGLVQSGDTASLLKIALLISPMGILLAGVGMFMLIGEAKRKGVLLFLSIGLAETVILLYGGFITPAYFWAARRDIPLFLPVAMLCIGHTLVTLNGRTSGILRWALPAALGLAVLAPGVKASWPFLSHIEYAGAMSETNRLASAFPANAILLFEWSGEAYRFTTPLQFIYGRTSFLVPESSKEDPRLGRLVERWQQEGRPTYWISSQQKPPIRLPGLRLNFEATYSLVLPQAEVVADRLPAKVDNLITVFDVYELIPGSDPG